MAPAEMQIRPMVAGDAEAVLAIYRDGIETGHATFQDSAPDWPAFDAAHLAVCRLVATDRETESMLGWAAVSPVSARPVYRGVVEHSLYIASAARGRGIGRALLGAVIEDAETEGLWTLQSGIFPENEVSLALHRALGFRIVGTRERVGRMSHGPCAGQWRDVILVERRSRKVGTG